MTRRDAEDDSTMYEVTCPNCGQISTLDEETLMDPEGDLVCPHCGATFDIELEGTEDDSAEGDRQAGPLSSTSPFCRGGCPSSARPVLTSRCKARSRLAAGFVFCVRAGETLTSSAARPAA